MVRNIGNICRGIKDFRTGISVEEITKLEKTSLSDFTLCGAELLHTEESHQRFFQTCTVSLLVPIHSLFVPPTMTYLHRFITCTNSFIVCASDDDIPAPFHYLHRFIHCLCDCVGMSEREEMFLRASLAAKGMSQNLSTVVRQNIQGLWHHSPCFIQEYILICFISTPVQKPHLSSGYNSLYFPGETPNFSRKFRR